MFRWRNLIRFRAAVRWKYVAPRLFLLTMTAVLTWLCLDWLVEFGLIQSGQRLMRARVEIGDLDVRPSRGSLTLDQLTIADPDSALRNLLQAENVDLDVEIGAALRRKLIIRQGRLSGLRFHTPRDTDGRLSPASPDDEDGGSNPIWGDLADRGEAWLEDSLNQLESEAENELRSVQLARELKQRWPEKYRQLEQRVKQIERDGREVRKQVKQIADDPLSNLPQLQPALQGVEELRRNLLEVRQEVTRLQRQMQQDRQAIEQAKEHDYQYIKERLRLDDLDPDSLTQYLLGPVWGERVDTAMRWLQRSREAIPAQPSTPSRKTGHGISILFPGFPSLPDVLVRRLELSGDGTVDGQPYSFAGVIRDLTHQPHRHREPARVEIVAKGSIRMTAEAILDRRGVRPIDRFVVNLPAVRQHGQTLGDARRFAIAVSPGTARIQADIHVTDDQLGGQISLRQDDLRLNPKLSPKYSKFVSDKNLAAAVSQVRRMTATIHLDGTIKKPSYRLESNLGPELADGLNRAMRQELDDRQRELVAKANAELDEELDAMQQQFVSKQSEILQQLELGDEQLDQFRKMLTAHVGSPNDLISKGRKLLFK